MMTSANLDHNDKLFAAGKKEKLEWVTPKMMLMESDETYGKNLDQTNESDSQKVGLGNS